MKIKNKLTCGIVGTTLAVLLAGSTGYSQTTTQPSAKATTKIGLINVMNELVVGTNSSGDAVGPWVNVLNNNLKTPNQKDLFIGVSLEVGLLTDTLVRSKNGVTDTSSASAGVEVQVLIDGVPALPGKVVFGRRTQTLSATFQGLIDGCLTLNTNTGSIVIDTNCVTPESLGLVLDTMNANSFNFVVADLVAGVHVIQAQARLNLGASAQAGSARARALIGNGSLTVEQVRMIRNEDISLP
jgi:hypothetical protein